MDNKRKNKRLDCLVPVDGQKEGIFDNTQAVDFSKGGIGFIANHKIPINKEIAIELMLEEESVPVIAIGKVQWVKSIPNSECYRIGMTFKEIMRGSKSRLNKHFVGK